MWTEHDCLSKLYPSWCCVSYYGQLYALMYLWKLRFSSKSNLYHRDELNYRKFHFPNRKRVTAIFCCNQCFLGQFFCTRDLIIFICWISFDWFVTYSDAKDCVEPFPSITEIFIGFMLRVAFVSFMSVQDPLKFPVVGRPLIEKSRKVSSSAFWLKKNKWVSCLKFPEV